MTISVNQNMNMFPYGIGGCGCGSQNYGTYMLGSLFGLGFNGMGFPTLNYGMGGGCCCQPDYAGMAAFGATNAFLNVAYTWAMSAIQENREAKSAPTTQDDLDDVNAEIKEQLDIIGENVEEKNYQNYYYKNDSWYKDLYDEITELEADKDIRQSATIRVNYKSAKEAYEKATDDKNATEDKKTELGKKLDEAKQKYDACTGKEKELAELKEKLKTKEAQYKKDAEAAKKEIASLIEERVKLMARREAERKAENEALDAKILDKYDGNMFTRMTDKKYVALFNDEGVVTCSPGEIPESAFREAINRYRKAANNSDRQRAKDQFLALYKEKYSNSPQSNIPATISAAKGIMEGNNQK